MDRFLRHSE